MGLNTQCLGQGISGVPCHGLGAPDVIFMITPSSYFSPPSRQGDCKLIAGEYQKTSTPGKYTYYNPSKLSSLPTCLAPRAAMWLSDGNQCWAQLRLGKGSGKQGSEAAPQFGSLPVKVWS